MKGSLLKKLSWQRIARFFKTRQSEHQAFVISRKDHAINMADISPNAIKVLNRLRSAGHDAYLVGGSVRDLLLHRAPKDFDIATNARPEEVRRIFRNSRLIGRRFRLVHVFYPDEVIEVSTFRANIGETHIPHHEAEEDDEKDEKAVKPPGMLAVDNTFGTIEEDAWRRDFTLNALYFDNHTQSVVDYTGGMLDLQKRVIRMIGDPTQRFHEDPVRLLRALRLSAKLEFKIDETMEAPLLRLGHLLGHVPKARLLDEMVKLFFEGNAALCYQQLCRYKYIYLLFPDTVKAIQGSTQRAGYEKLLWLGVTSTDNRIGKQQSVQPAFLWAVFLWPNVNEQVSRLRAEQSLFSSWLTGVRMALDQQTQIIAFPRRACTMMKSIWMLQYHLECRRPKRIFGIFQQRYFRASYDFLMLRAAAGLVSQELVDWWKAFQDGEPQQRREMIEVLKQREPTN